MFVKYLGLALQIVQALMTAEAQFEAAGAVAIPAIRAYIGTTHVELDLSVKKI